MEQDQIIEHLTHLTNTVTGVLSWLQAAEDRGVVPKGTLKAAVKHTHKQRLESRAAGMEEALALLADAEDLTSLQRSLEASLFRYRMEAPHEKT